MVSGQRVSFRLLLLLPVVGLLFSACAPVALVGAGVVATETLGERRGPRAFFDDNWIALSIRSAFVRSDVVSAGRINVSVYRGHVTLTGGAVSDQEREEAHRLASEIKGVEKVSNEVKVMGVSATDLLADSLISNAVKLKILADDGVRGFDFHVETTKRVVYITGLARSIAERDRAVELARSVNGVAEVVSFIEVEGEDPSPDASSGSQ